MFHPSMSSDGFLVSEFAYIHQWEQSSKGVLQIRWFCYKPFYRTAFLFLCSGIQDKLLGSSSLVKIKGL